MDYLADDYQMGNKETKTIQKHQQTSSPVKQWSSKQKTNIDETVGLWCVYDMNDTQKSKQFITYARTLNASITGDIRIFVHTKFQNVTMKEKKYPNISFISNDSPYSGVLVKITFSGCCPCLVLNMKDRRNVVYHLSGKMHIFREWYLPNGTGNKIAELTQESLLRDLFDGLNWVCEIPRKYW
jgi:hypothetical protein